MKAILVLLVITCVPSLVAGQSASLPKWSVGFSFGYSAVNPRVIEDAPVTLDSSDRIVAGDPKLGDDGGEGTVSMHVGRAMSRSLRAEALLSMSLLGIGFGGADKAVLAVSDDGRFTVAMYDHGTGSGFLTTGASIVAEPLASHARIRPRASVSALWEWTKGPAAVLTAGLSTGSPRTRFVFDAGAQLTRLQYDRVFQTYQISTRALLDEQTLTGTKILSGFSIRFGVEHFIF